MSTGFNTSLRYFIALSILALLTMPVSRAQPDNVISIGDVVVGPGGSVTVPITITNSTGIASVGLRLRYNPAVVNVTGATEGDFTFVFNCDYSTAANGWVLINTFITGTDLTGNLTVANVTLQAVGVIGSTSQLNLEISGTGIGISNQYGYNVPAVVRNGTLTIREPSIGYSVFVTPGQNTYIQSSNGNFGWLLTGYSRILSNSLILNNTGTVAAKVEAHFIDSVYGVHGIINGTNVLNASNFALGNSTFIPLNNSGADVQVGVASPGLTTFSARLSVPVDQAAGNYGGTVILIFSNAI